MAQDKKSFVLYSDLLNLVSQLPDETAGKLFKIILQYVNDVEVCIEDLLLKIAFEPIKMQLERDFKKWDKIKIRRSEAGKQGGRPKKEEVKIDLQTEEEKAKKAFAFSEKQTKAKKAVTDNVTVNGTVNVTVNDILLEKETKGDLVFSNSETQYFSVKNEKEEKRKKVAPKKEKEPDCEILKIPPNFQTVWQEWLEYRKAKKKKPYVAVKYEQIAFDNFFKMSKGEPEIASKILNQTIVRAWDGLFELKENQIIQNGNTTVSANRNR